jgi:hypothetical protein
MNRRRNNLRHERRDRIRRERKKAWNDVPVAALAPNLPDASENLPSARFHIRSWVSDVTKKPLCACACVQSMYLLVFFASLYLFKP